MSGDKTNRETKDGVEHIGDACRTDIPTQSEKNAGEEANHGEESGDGERSRSKAPIDRGWAWVVLLVSCLVIFLFGGILRSFGVYFVQYQKRFHSSASETALMVMIQNLVASFCSLFVMTVVVEKITCRGAVMTSGLLYFVAYVITAFTTSLTVYYLAQGVIGGMAFALAVPPFFAMLGTYFKKHRGLATSVFSSSVSSGGIVFPSVVVKMFAEYGFSGTMLISGAVAFNFVLMGAVLRPIESYYHTAQTDKQQTVRGETILESERNVKDALLDDESSELQMTKDRIIESKAEHGTTHNGNERVTPFKLRRQISYDHEQAMAGGQASPLIIRAFSTGHRAHEKSYDGDNQSMSTEDQHHPNTGLSNIMDALSHSQTSLSVSVNDVYVSCLDISNESTKHIEDIKQFETKQKGVLARFKDAVLSIFLNIFDLILLKDPKFIMFLFMAFSFVGGGGLVPAFLPPLATDVEISNTQIGMSISVLAGVETGTKIVLGVVADRKWVRRTTILAFLGFLMGTVCHLARYVTDFNTLVVFAAISGLCCQQYNSMFSVVLVELIGLQLFKKALGLVTFLHGISIAMCFPLAGFLRDISGSYIYTFHLLGSVLYIGAIVAAFIPVVISRHGVKTPPGQEDTKTPPEEQNTDQCMCAVISRRETKLSLQQDISDY